MITCNRPNIRGRGDFLDGLYKDRHEKAFKYLWLDFWRFFESPPLAAPVAAAVFAVPLRHSFPLLPISDDGLAFINGALERWRHGAMNDRHNVRRAALGAGRCFACSFRIGGLPSHLAIYAYGAAALF